MILMSNKSKYSKPGRPVTHPKILNLELNKIYDTYIEAAKDVKGSKQGVYKAVHGLQRTHRKCRFIFVGIDLIQ